MRIQYMSDLHLEFGDMEVPLVEGDVLVLVGDIHVGTQGVGFITKCAEVFPHVLVLMGNHEFYNHNNIATLSNEILDELKNPAFNTPDNVHLLDNYSIQIDDVNFIGTTLWSDINNSAFYRMNDSRVIHNGDGWLEPQHVRKFFLDNVEFIKNNLMDDVKNVVLTHHAPSQLSIDSSRYAGETIMNTGYATDILGQFKGQVVLWVHGHTHHCVDYEEHGIRVVSNQRGYVNHDEVRDFNPSATVEI